MPGLELLDGLESESCNRHYCVVDVDPIESGLTRDEWVHVLGAENVFAKEYFSPACHEMLNFSDCEVIGTLEVTERLRDRLMQLPCGGLESIADVDRIADLIEFCTQNSREIANRLRAGNS